MSGVQQSHQLRDGAKVSKPPTAVGGWFRSDLQYARPLSVFSFSRKREEKGGKK